MHRLLVVLCRRASPRRRSVAQGAPDRSKPPALGAAAAARAAADSEADALERAAGVDRRDARGAARPGQSGRARRQRRRPGRQVRRGEPDGGDARRGRRARASALEIADAVEFLGAALSHQQLVRRLGRAPQRAGARGCATALPLMADVALRPTFPAAELERLRQERLTALLQARDDPGVGRAAGVRARGLRRARTATARRASGTEATLKAFTVQDLRALSRGAVPAGERHADRRRRRDSRRRAAAAREAVRRVEGRRAAGARTPRAARRRSSPQRQITIVDMPGAAQSQIRIGWVGVPRSTPDYFALAGAEHDSRRLVHVAAQPEPAREARLRLRRQLAVRHAAVGRAVPGRRRRADRQDGRGAARVLQRAEGDRQAGRRRASSTKAKNYVALGFPGEFETIGDLSSHLEELVVYKLPDTTTSRSTSPTCRR